MPGTSKPPTSKRQALNFALRALVAVFILSITLPARGQTPASAKNDALTQFRSLMNKLSSAPADDCGWESQDSPTFSEETAKLENQIFQSVDAAVAAALNSSPDNPKRAAVELLNKMQAISEIADKTWPTGRRFHFDILDAPPALVLKMGIRSRTTFSAFAVPEILPNTHGRKNTTWVRVGDDEGRWGEHNFDESMDIFPLKSGTSGRARFLSKSSHMSCGDGQTAIEYIGYEWDPSGPGELHTVIQRKGAVSGVSFPAIGELRTEGPKITLPYCWWSPIDGSVWAALCSVDTYDLSTGSVRFVRTETNRPDLETVARAIEYSQARDLRALLAYCASVSVAKQMVSLMPPSVFNSGGSSLQEPDGNRQTVDISNSEHLRFVLERRNGRWLIVRFLLNPKTNPQVASKRRE